MQSNQVSRPGGEQALVINHEGEQHEATLRTVIRPNHEGEDVERDEYHLADEDAPDAVVEHVDSINRELAERHPRLDPGATGGGDPDVEADQEESDDPVCGSSDTASGEPCQRAVSEPDETCQDH